MITGHFSSILFTPFTIGGGELREGKAWARASQFSCLTMKTKEELNA